MNCYLVVLCHASWIHTVCFVFVVFLVRHSVHYIIGEHKCPPRLLFNFFSSSFDFSVILLSHCLELMMEQASVNCIWLPVLSIGGKQKSFVNSGHIDQTVSALQCHKTSCSDRYSSVPSSTLCILPLTRKPPPTPPPTPTLWSQISSFGASVNIHQLDPIILEKQCSNNRVWSIYWLLLSILLFAVGVTGSQQTNPSAQSTMHSSIASDASNITLPTIDGKWQAYQTYLFYWQMSTSTIVAPLSLSLPHLYHPHHLHY